MAISKFIKGRLKGIYYAFRGALILLKTEASIQVQTIIAIFITFLGFYYNISTLEWIAQFLCIGLVLTAEGMNTAIEEIADFIHPEFNTKIGKIKDIAAGAVGFAALITFIVGLLIYFPKFF